MMTQPNGMRVWVSVGLAFILALSGWAYSAGSLSMRVAQNTEKNSEQALLYVPRTEIDAKLENIQLQVESVKEDVGELKAQSAQQTEEIIRRIERLMQPRRNQ